MQRVLEHGVLEARDGERMDARKEGTVRGCKKAATFAQQVRYPDLRCSKIRGDNVGAQAVCQVVFASKHSSQKARAHQAARKLCK